MRGDKRRISTRLALDHEHERSHAALRLEVAQHGLHLPARVALSRAGVQAAPSARAGKHEGGPSSSQASISTIRRRARPSSSSRSGDGGLASSCRASSRSCISRSSCGRPIGGRSYPGGSSRTHPAASIQRTGPASPSPGGERLRSLPPPRRTSAGDRCGGRGRGARGSGRRVRGRAARHGRDGRWLRARSRELRVDLAGRKTPCEKTPQDVLFRLAQAMPSARRLVPGGVRTVDAPALKLHLPAVAVRGDVYLPVLRHISRVPGTGPDMQQPTGPGS